MTTRRYTLYVVLPLVAICTSIFLLMLIQRTSSLSIWDDAYFFIRYADNLVQHGQLTWNPDGIPTYGLTSPAYLLVVIPFRLILPSEAALVLILSSLSSGLVAIVMMSVLALRVLREQTHRLTLLCIIMISLVVASEHITTHLTSGMDTMFAIACLSSWLLLLNTSHSAFKAGIFAGLFFWIRPDILLIVGCAGLFEYRFSHSQLGRFVAATLLTICVQLTINAMYFNQILPSPFYAKNLPVYGEAFYAFYECSSRESFIQFIFSYPYLILLSFVGAIKIVKVRMLLIATLPFYVYQIFFVVPIMGFSQRFYYPLIPILLLALTQSIPAIVRLAPASIKMTLQNYPLPQLFVPLLLILTLINPMPIIVMLVQYTKGDEEPTSLIGQFDLQKAYESRYFDNWYRLDALSSLDDTLIIATTEVGLPSVMNPEKAIIDLAGLNDIQYIDSTSFINRLLYQNPYPDWIYMPFPHYERMWYSIYNDPTFQLDYDYFSARTLGTSMDVAIRRSSPFYLDMLEILIDE